MKFRPLHDWILIKRSKPVEMTGSGIIIPDTAKDKPAEGTVEAVGPGRYKQEKGKKDKKFFPTVLKPGQKVMFIDYMAKDVELDAKEITLIREDDVLGIIEHKGELTVKNAYPVEIKKDRPPMVQTEAAVGVKPPAKTKRKRQAEAEVRTTAAKSPKKGKEGTMKKTVKKAAPAKKTTAKKMAKKAAPKKTVAKKSVKKATVKKATPKKTVKKAVAKKAAPKKTAKKTTKKTKK